MTPRKEERIKAALILRQQGMKPVEIKKALNIRDWKTVWRIFHQYAGDYAVDHTVDNLVLDTRAGKAHTARQIAH